MANNSIFKRGTEVGLERRAQSVNLPSLPPIFGRCLVIVVLVGNPALADPKSDSIRTQKFRTWAATLDQSVTTEQKSEVLMQMYGAISSDPDAVPPELGKSVRPLLKTDDIQIRRQTLLILSDLKDIQSLSDVQSMAFGEKDRTTRRFAIHALAQISGKKADIELKQLIKDKDPAISLQAAQSLGDLGDSSGNVLARDALQSEDSEVRDMAASALGHIGGVENREEIRLLLDKQKLNPITANEAILRIEMGELATDADRIAFLVTEIRTSKGDRQVMAAWALGSMIRNPEAKFILKRIATDPLDPGFESARRVALRFQLTTE